jgi:predicted nucleic acid-binding protein
MSKFVSLLGDSLQARGKPRVRVVIDSNIIFGDALRVARGLPSSTDRILRSRFIEPWAPRQIREEVEQNIREEFPRLGASVEDGLAHANKLLSELRLVDDADIVSVQRARDLISPFDPDDVPFLALSFDLDADAIVSRDKESIGRQTEMTQWDIGDLAKTVVIYESGSLALVITAGAFDLAITALEAVLIATARAFQSALAAIAALVGAVGSGIANAIAQLPPEIVAAIGVAVLAGIVAVIIAAIASETFRDQVSEGIAAIGDFISWVARAVIRLASAIASSLWSMISWLWDTVQPAAAFTVVAAGVLFRRIDLLVKQIEAGAA